MIAIDIPRLGYGGLTLARDIRLDIAPGECILLAGANGSGKTSLLRAISREEPAALYLPTGIPKVKGFSVRAFIRTACFKESTWKRSPELEDRISAALTTLGIEELDGRDLPTLSDGQFQKACLAIALSRHASLLLLDEPTAFLDVEGRRSVLNAIRALSRTTGIPVLFSSHDLMDALAVADRVAGIAADGRFLVSSPADREKTLDHLFSWR